MDQEISTPQNSEERNWGMYAHLLGLAGIVVPILGGIAGPLAILKTKGRHSAYVAAQAREALNFQLSVALAMLAAFALMYVLIGVFLLIGIFIADIGCCVRATAKAARGEMQRYPYRFAFLR